MNSYEVVITDVRPTALVELASYVVVFVEESINYTVRDVVRLFVSLKKDRVEGH